MARILYIESDRMFGTNVIRVMKRAGHGVDWHVDLQAAIDSADAVRPDIIVLDLFLAGRSGIEFLYEFRSYPEWQNVPVLVYSSVPAEEFNQALTGAKKLGVNSYFHKPNTSIKDLLRSIDSALSPAIL